MKKNSVKLAISKTTIASLENIVGGHSETSYSCPGDQCETSPKTCANGLCEYR